MGTLELSVGDLENSSTLLHALQKPIDLSGIKNSNNFESKILAKLRDGKDGENVFEKVLIMKDKGIISLIE